MSRVLTVNFTKAPFKIGGKELSKLTYREPLVDDHTAAHAAAAEEGLPNNMVASEKHLLAAITGLVADEIGALPAADYRVLKRPLEDFFSSPSTDYGAEYSSSPASGG